MSKIGNNPNENIVAANGALYLCKNVIDSPVVIPDGYNAGTFGSVTITGTGSVTIPDGSSWTIVGGN
jgi:hypothetical protein